jgi:hypothetical protein
MTNREVYIEVEETVAKYYPSYTDSEELRIDVNRLVKMVKFELNLPKGMAVNYVRNVFSAYIPRVENE